jgi:glyoxylase-like metal-dependent hydrolase (beta-lactamase superfamily II)
MKKYILHPSTFKLDGGAMFGIIPRPLWQKKIQPDGLNRILMSLRVIYIETHNKKILIDTGIGDYHSKKFNQQFDIQSEQNPLKTILKKQLNIDADEITDIILTHLHFDHVGGLGNGNSELIFPKATVHVHKDHYEYALNPTIRDAGSFQKHFFKPLLDQYSAAGQLNLVQGEEGQIVERDIQFKISFGHTPSMLHPIFDGCIYMADLVPMSHHINIPWVMGYDIEPGVTTVYKEKFYEYILDHNLKMIFEHDLDVYGATIHKDEKGRYHVLKSFEATNDSSMEI